MKFLNMCKSPVNKIAIIVAIVAAISSNHHADAKTSVSASSAQVNTAHASAQKTDQIGSLHMEVYGNPKGKVLILIPGLSSGAYVWDETIARFEKDYRIYAVTLSGFNGLPSLPGAKILKAKQSLLELIDKEKLDKPILIGHSLGAVLATWFAEDYADRIGAVVAVDGMPVFPRTENIPAAQRPAMAAAMKAQMANISQADFEAQQQQFMQSMGVVDAALAKKIAVLSSKSDRVAVRRIT